MKECFIHIGEASIIIIERDEDQEDWAHVLLNLKYKLFQPFLIENRKIRIFMLTQNTE